MCSSPLTTPDGTQFACRTCGECVTTRKHNWIARAMAERATNKYTVSLTLTYNDDTEANRDGAQFFRYSDVNALMKRLRRALAYSLKCKQADAPDLRFICAGELGSDRGRCHWHILVFSDSDPLPLGKWSLFKNNRPVNTREGKITVGKDRIRLNWSLWPHGFVTVQEPDQGGVEYAMTYALKDQFGVAKAEGTSRHHKAESIATGMFRMSKHPPIGEAFLLGIIERFAHLKAVPIALQFKIPDYTGYWRPVGRQRDLLIDACHEINAKRIVDTGRRCPQWTTLVASIKNETDQERLIHGPETEQDTWQEFEDELLPRLRTDQKEIATRARRAETRRRCGGFGPCASCAAGWTEQEVHIYRVAALEQADILGIARGKHPAKQIEAVEDYHRENYRGPSQFCLLREQDHIQRACEKPRFA